MKDYPIRIVKGNYFAIAQTLEKITWENVTKQKVDYIPDVGDKITVTLVGNYNKYDVVNVSIDGNKLLYNCNGILSTGTYGIEVKVTCTDGKRLRSFQRDRIQIVNSNEEAGIQSGDEFDVDTYEIDSAVLLYVKGDRGYSAYEIAVQNGFEGTEEEWLESLKGADGTMTFEDLKPAQRESLKGDRGEQGIGIQSIEQTTTATESEGVNEVTITLNDDNHTEYTFEVKNGAQGTKGDDGKSAYQVYLDTVPEGETPMTEQDWLASLKGEKGDDGDDGKSAYQVYLDNVPSGETPMTEAQWLASLKGEKGDQGAKGDTVVLGDGQTYTLYNVLGNNTDGAMTQAAVTALFVPVTSSAVAEMLDPS